MPEARRLRYREIRVFMIVRMSIVCFFTLDPPNGFHHATLMKGTAALEMAWSGSATCTEVP